MRLPLEDVTVLDLSHALAGPFCSTMLADFGARVIKLEPKGAGDIARAWGTPLPGGETAYFVSLHRNKQGIEVDLNLYFRPSLTEMCCLKTARKRYYAHSSTAPRTPAFSAADLTNPSAFTFSMNLRT